jgi:DNA-binding transcriptional LysR family regulator
VGAALFVRSTRGVRLTDAGERLLPYARRLLDLCQEADQAVRRGDSRPPIRVGVHTTFAHRVVPTVVAAAATHRRGVIVRDAHTDDVIAMLLDGVVDIGFVLPGARPPALRIVPLPSDPVIAVCAPSHPLAGRIAGVRSLVDHPVALNRWGDGVDRFFVLMQQAGMPEWRVTECSDGHTALGLARDHYHIALVAASTAEPALATGTVTRLVIRPALRWTVPLAFTYRRAAHDDPLVNDLRTALRA